MRDLNRSGYRLVGKDGKVIYFEKKRPQFNEEQLKKNSPNKKLETAKLESVNGNVDKKKAGEQSKTDPKDTTILDSSAYTLRSVMDNIVKNEDINAMAKSIEASTTGKSIKDFENIPDTYFENVPDNERLTVKQNQNFLTAKKIDNQRKFFEMNTELSTSLVRNKYYLQLGSFRSKIKAEKVLNKYADVGGNRQVVEGKNGGLIFYRAIIGTFNTNLEASNVKNKLIERGHTDVFVFKN
jgi:cell division protein FtsN